MNDNLRLIIKQSLLKVKSSFSIPTSFSLSSLEYTWNDVVVNTPEIFYEQGYQYCLTNKNCIIKPNYIYDLDSIRALKAKCLEEAECIARIANREKDDYSKVLKVHDILCKKIRYCASDELDLHTIVAPLTRKSGVCDGFSKTFKYVLEKLGIESCVVSGNAWSPMTTNSGLHSWNMVNLYGNWYHVDVTFDCTLVSKKVLRHDYFFLSDKEIMEDHRYAFNNYPKATDETISYYKRNNIFFSDQTLLYKYLENQIANGISDILFRINLNIKVNPVDYVNDVVMKISN